MEFNPYQPPAAPVAGIRRGAMGKLYAAFNVLYAALILCLTLVLLVTRPPPLDLLSFWTALYFYAPVICFLMLRWARPAWYYRVLATYGVYVAFLFGIMVWKLASAQGDVAVGMAIVGPNLVGWGAACLHVRSRTRVPELI